MKSNELPSKTSLDKIEKSYLLKIIEESGIIDSFHEENRREKAEKYAETIARLVEATIPTHVIQERIETDQLNIVNSKDIKTFLSKNEHFDLATSHIEDYITEIKKVAGDNFDEVIRELKVLQRVYRISPGPENMEVLLENGLHSAYTVATIPRKSFIKQYSDSLGGKHVALAIHLRASQIDAKPE